MSSILLLSFFLLQHLHGLKRSEVQSSEGDYPVLCVSSEAVEHPWGMEEGPEGGNFPFSCPEIVQLHLRGIYPVPGDSTGEDDVCISPHSSCCARYRFWGVLECVISPTLPLVEYCRYTVRSTSFLLKSSPPMMILETFRDVPAAPCYFS